MHPNRVEYMHYTMVGCMNPIMVGYVISFLQVAFIREQMRGRTGLLHRDGCFIEAFPWLFGIESLSLSVI